MISITSTMLIVLMALASAPAGASNGVISGQLLGNGKPMVGVTIEMYSRNHAQDFSLIAQTRTGAEGRFRFDDVPAGRYAICPRAYGWVMAASGFSSYAMHEVSILDGESRTDVAINLDRGGVITGKILHPDGRPAVEHSVNVLNGEQLPHISIYKGDMLTDDRGIYRVYGLPPGRYKVSSRNTWYPGVMDREKAQEVEVRSGVETTGIDFRLGQVTENEPEVVSVSGRVIARDTGEPVPMAGVRLLFRSPDGRYLRIPVSANQAGEFRYERCGAGEYRILSVGDGKRYGSSNAVDIVVGDSDVTGIELRAEIGGRLTGELVWVGPSEQKLEEFYSKAALNVLHRFESTTFPDVRYAKLDRQGRFNLLGLAPGDYKIELDAQREPGWVLLGAENSHIGGGHWFTVGAGEEITNLRLRLSRGTAVMRGRVKASEGALPPNIILNIMAWQDEWLEQHGMTMDMADANGRFRLGGLLPGRYQVACEFMFNGPPPAAWIGRRSPRIQSVDITEGQTVEVEIRIDDQ